MKLYISEATLRTIEKFGNASLTHISATPSDHMSVELDASPMKPSLPARTAPMKQASLHAPSVEQDERGAFIKAVQSLAFLCRTETKRLDRETLAALDVVEDHLVSMRASIRDGDGELRAASTSANVAQGAEAVATVKVYETYTGQNGWIEVTQEEYDRTKDKYEHRIRRVSAPPAQTALTDAARDVLAERCRQVEAEGFTTARDDGYADGQLAQAGAAYALAVADHTNHTINSGAAFYTRSPDIWPWSEKWWKPTSPRRALVKAGALILAEIERLDRRALTAAQSASGDTK
jgi:hypothetical protein